MDQETITSIKRKSVVFSIVGMDATKEKTATFSISKCPLVRAGQDVLIENANWIMAKDVDHDMRQMSLIMKSTTRAIKRRKKKRYAASSTIQMDVKKEINVTSSTRKCPYVKTILLVRSNDANSNTQMMTALLFWK